VRRKVRGTADRPRLAVFRSLRHIYAQIIDDGQGATLAAASSLDGEVREARDGKTKSTVSSEVGSLIGRRAKAKGIDRVVFDRSGNQYHGRLKALAEAARKEGLTF
jgi:large subunit ribosomal protein L18